MTVVPQPCPTAVAAAVAPAASISVLPRQAHATDSEARSAAAEASEGLRAARIAEMSTTGSMVTLSSLATMDEDVDTLQVHGAVGGFWGMWL